LTLHAAGLPGLGSCLPACLTILALLRILLLLQAQQPPILSFSSPTQRRPGPHRTPRSRCGAACPSRSPPLHLPSLAV
jgi:hypothetical protein